MKILFLSILFIIGLESCTSVVKESDFFHPRKTALLSDKIQRRNISITVEDSLKIRGWYLSSPENQRSMIYFYGNGENLADIQTRLYYLSEQYSLNVIAVDYRGYGVSDGSPALDVINNDALKIYDFLLDSLHASDKPVFVFGRSIGTIFAEAVALKRKVNGLVLQAPMTSVTDVVAEYEKQIPWYLWFVNLEPEQNLLKKPQPIETIQKIAAPLLVIHGTEDEVFPLWHGKMIFEKAGSSQKFWRPVEGASHNYLPMSQKDVAESLKSFFDTFSQ